MQIKAAWRSGSQEDGALLKRVSCSVGGFRFLVNLSGGGVQPFYLISNKLQLTAS